MVRQAAMDGEEIPVEETPELDPALSFYIIAFVDLSTERCVEGGPIPWSSIQLYSVVQGLDEEQTTRLHFITRALEKVVDEHNAKKREADKKKAERKTPRRKRR